MLPNCEQANLTDFFVQYKQNVVFLQVCRNGSFKALVHTFIIVENSVQRVENAMIVVRKILQATCKNVENTPHSTVSR